MNVHSHDLMTAAPNRVPRSWATLSCPRCAGLVILEQLPHGLPDGVVRILPDGPSSQNRVQHLPPDIERYYTSAIRVLDAGVPDAAAVQLRRTLEAAAAANGITQGPLVRRIRQLITQGKITAEFGEVLDHIRQVGNVGAHAGEAAVDEESARRALLFTTQVLRNLFEIPAELMELRGVEPSDVEAQDG